MTRAAYQAVDPRSLIYWKNAVQICCLSLSSLKCTPASEADGLLFWDLMREAERRLELVPSLPIQLLLFEELQYIP
jgi:hypothetical protein